MRCNSDTFVTLVAVKRFFYFLFLQELSNPCQRDRLLSAMMILKKSIGLLSTSMQTYLKNPANLQTKVCERQQYFFIVFQFELGYTNETLFRVCHTLTN